MLTLYYKPTCAFSRHVISTAARLELELELKDITSNEAYEAELLELGERVQVPFLVDSDAGVSLFESEEIVRHLQSTYGKSVDTVARPRIHVSGSTCVSCEA
mgnify:CR=1 FL=1